MHVTGRADRPAAPAIGEQRPAPLAIDKLRVGLGPDQSAPERRVHRRNQQSMIPPRQAEGDRAGGIAATPVGEPPFAALGLMEIAADRPAEADHLRHRAPCLRTKGGRSLVRGLLPGLGEERSCSGRLTDQDPDFGVGLPPLIFMQVPAGT